jgi:hypothetical protein
MIEERLFVDVHTQAEGSGAPFVVGRQEVDL